ncbi:MAG: monovalent cation/H(+) antiporter subunit G [Nitrospirae bacterium]|nr:monovalent cation/H(+) antiporter subunit G [Nitrospirota bacterium]
MSVTDILTSALLITGAFFFLSGTIGVLRLPDVFTRLHAVTKADNLGLGLTAAGLMLQADSIPGALKLFLIWLLVIANSATISYLLAQSARERGVRPWRRGDDNR